MTYSTAKMLKENALRHQMILETAKGFGNTFTCKDITNSTGLNSRNVTASLQYLLKGKVIEIVGEYCDQTGWKAVYALTGTEFDREEIGKMYSREDKKLREPLGRIEESEVKPGHRVVRFGSDWKPGSGQSYGLEKRGFSSIFMVGE